MFIMNILIGNKIFENQEQKINTFLSVIINDS
jgi:hypothetical protein